MTLDELVALTRTELVTLGLGKLCIDPLIISRLNSAYRLFVTGVGNIDDEVEIEVVANDVDVPYPDWVLKFRHITLDGEPLAIVNPSDVDFMRVTASSEPQLFVIGDRVGYAKVFGAPKSNGTLFAKVQREIKAEMLLGSDSPVDVPASHQIALIDWAVAQFLMTDERETIRVTMMRDRLSRFAMAIESVKTLFSRKRTKPIRTVRYGGI